MSRQKPNVSLARLRVESYGVLNARLRRVHERLIATSPEMITTMQAIKEQPLLALAQQLGFDEAWFSQEVVPVKGKSKAINAPVPADQQTLPGMLAAIPKVPPSQALRAPPPAASPVLKAGAAAVAMPKVLAKGPAPSVGVATPVAKAKVAPVPPKMPGVAAEPAAAHSPLVIVPKMAPPVQSEAPQEVGQAAVVAGADDESLDEIMAGGDGGEATEEAVMIGDPDEPLCVICQQPLRSATDDQPVLALECGHTHHESCLFSAWQIGGHQHGWCPFKCDVRQQAAQIEDETMQAPGHSQSVVPQLSVGIAL